MPISWIRSSCGESLGSLLLISTGNISNDDLEQLLTPNLEQIVATLEEADFVEVARSGIVVHY